MSSDPSLQRQRIFLSYGHHDAMEPALNLRTELDAAGYDLWQDEKRIRAGRSWTDEIREALRESDLVIALLSPHSVRRKGWGRTWMTRTASVWTRSNTPSMPAGSPSFPSWC